MMTRKGKMFAVALLSLAGMIIALFAGCSLSKSVDDYIKEYNLTAKVTYYSNGGTFENNSTKKDIYYRDNAIVLNIGDPSVSITSGSSGIKRDGYVFEGWYYAKLDADGNVVYTDEEKTVVELGEPVDFTVPIGNGEAWTIYAAWSRDVLLEIKLADDIVLADGGKAEKGSLLAEYHFGIDGNINKPSGEPQKYEDYTFVTYYSDPECTEIAEWPVRQTEDMKDNVVYYAKYIEGTWTIVSNTSDFSRMNLGLSRRYYLLNDIDCSSLSARSVYSTFACELAGNGHTIKNLKLTSTPVNDSSVAVFGSVKETAYMHDVTFENLTVSYTVRPSFKVSAYLFCASVEEGARFENVSISATMEVTLAAGASIYNIPLLEDGYAKTNWLFGGFDTDEKFFDKYSGVTVSDTSDVKIM